jgi:hypothetical protein
VLVILVVGFLALATIGLIAPFYRSRVLRAARRRWRDYDAAARDDEPPDVPR